MCPTILDHTHLSQRGSGDARAPDCSPHKNQPEPVKGLCDDGMVNPDPVHDSDKCAWGEVFGSDLGQHLLQWPLRSLCGVAVVEAVARVAQALAWDRVL